MIAMSGGVDSSVAAYLMRERGYTCIGVTMKLFYNEDAGVSWERACCSLDDVADARSVAHSLGMPFYVFNFSTDFHREVICRFIDAYAAGDTPNPCIDCNRYMKFEKLFLRAKQLQYDCIATGHYARIEPDHASGRLLLRKAADADKDQTYVLYFMTQAQLAHTTFPLGNLRKKDVRAIAQAQGFINAKKQESQDICFVPDGNYAEFIERNSGRRWPEGNFIDDAGKVLGRHRGHIRYTVGQRKGLGVAAGYPVYVCSKSVADNTVTLGGDTALYTRACSAGDFNWIACAPPAQSLRIKAKIRYRQAEQWAQAEPVDAHTVQICFDQPQRAITTGQAVVLYDGDTVVGGGTITAVVS
jgi:tRNA-specific 2-thiouridylase